MNMKKYLLVIVEGKNDKTEIQAILRAAIGHEFCAKYKDVYHIHNQDITSENGVTEKTIRKKLTDLVVSWRQGREEPFLPLATSDIEKIIHIIDTDGAFIPENSVIQTDDAKIQYFDKEIHIDDAARIIGRNRKKTKVVKKLLETKQIDNIPYEIYFASCNMDHVLFDDRNALPVNKRTNAEMFMKKCTTREYLQNSIFAPQICAGRSYMESWQMIMQSQNSLQRHTNINLFLDELM